MYANCSAEAKTVIKHIFSVYQIFILCFSAKQTSVKNFSNTAPVASIPLSKICRKNLFGETLLHKAVAEDDTDLVRKIIKVGANVNTQDYAGKFQFQLKDNFMNYKTNM